jgi:hypothetical protein
VEYGMVTISTDGILAAGIYIDKKKIEMLIIVCRTRNNKNIYLEAKANNKYFN